MSEQPVDGGFSLQKTEMGLGAWAWGDRSFWHYGHGYTDDDIAAAFGVSLAAGVHLVDTAEIYGAGRSERILGQLIKNAGKTVFVATKFFPLPYRISPNSVVRALRGSLERLELENVDLYQLHWPSPLVPVETYVEGLVLVVQAGLAKSVGVSNYNIDQMKRASKVLARHGFSLAANQVEYNLLERSVEKNGLLDYCKQTGVRLIAYSPLAKGVLTGKYTLEFPPPQPRGRKYAPILKALPSLISLMREIGKAHGDKNAGQVALNWVMCKGGLPIPGAKTADQAEQNVGALGWRLSPEDVKTLDDASDQLF